MLAVCGRAVALRFSQSVPRASRQGLVAISAARITRAGQFGKSQRAHVRRFPQPMKGKGASRAFTLLELLVAATITLLIAGVMLSVTAGMLGLWRRSQSAHTQATAARQVFDLIEQDLHAAVHRPDATCWLAIDILDTAAELANHGWLLRSGNVKPANGGSLRLLPPVDSEGRR